MIDALKSSWGWLGGAVTLLGAAFGFLFFLTDPKEVTRTGWLYLVLFVGLCIICWLAGGLSAAVREQRKTVAKVSGVFSATDNPGNDLSFLLAPNISFSSLLKCSVFYLKDGVELYLGGAYVDNVQEDKQIQLKIGSREASKAAVWAKIEANDKTVLDNILVKVGERMQ